jgi:hypothetical protein
MVLGYIGRGFVWQFQFDYAVFKNPAYNLLVFITIPISFFIILWLLRHLQLSGDKWKLILLTAIYCISFYGNARQEWALHST